MRLALFSYSLPKRSRRGVFSLAIAVFAIIGLTTANAQTANIKALLETVNKVAPLGAGHEEAVKAVAKLSQLPAAELTTLLSAMNDANPLALNWLRAAVEAVADHTLHSGQKLPIADLEKFALNVKQGDRARRLAFELLTRDDPNTPERLLPQMLNDPSLELRRDAIARLQKQTDELAFAKAAPEKIIDGYRQAFTAARDVDQIDALAKQLRDLKQQVDLPRHYGFVMDWQLIGPFDNADKKGFPVAYPPEQQVDFAATYPGKSGPVKWVTHQSTDQNGAVDLNKALGKHKGAITYAAAEFTSDKETPCQLRLGCINANKIWLNGELLFEREVYHTAFKIDQYVANGILKPGKNVILLKICQNEQTESWAQDWAFQLRVCDTKGTAILADNRPATPPAALEPPPKPDENAGK